MRLLLAAAVLAVALCAHAQSQGEQAQNRYWGTPDHEGWVTDNSAKPSQEDLSLFEVDGIAVLLSKKASVRTVIGWDRYLIDETDLSNASYSNGFDSDGYSVTKEGIEIDGSVHGPDALIPWKHVENEMSHILAVAKKNGKQTAPEQLGSELGALLRRMKALKAQKKAETTAAALGECAREEYELSKVDVDALAAELDRLVLSASKAQSPRAFVEAIRDLDLFKLKLPK